ncbi:hypothetical protein QIH15_27170, partial [Klebsiella pneumoniae]|nr:hypothetical protein [Klebsiella pneumoniae]
LRQRSEPMSVSFSFPFSNSNTNALILKILAVLQCLILVVLFAHELIGANHMKISLAEYVDEVGQARAADAIGVH